MQQFSIWAPRKSISHDLSPTDNNSRHDGSRQGRENVRIHQSSRTILWGIVQQLPSYLAEPLRLAQSESREKGFAKAKFFHHEERMLYWTQTLKACPSRFSVPFTYIHPKLVLGFCRLRLMANRENDAILTSCLVFPMNRFID